MRLGSIDLSDLGTLNPILIFAMTTSYVGRFDPYRTKVLIDVVILLHENVPLAQSQSSWVAERTMGIAATQGADGNGNWCHRSFCHCSRVDPALSKVPVLGFFFSAEWQASNAPEQVVEWLD